MKRWVHLELLGGQVGTNAKHVSHGMRGNDGLPQSWEISEEVFHDLLGQLDSAVANIACQGSFTPGEPHIEEWGMGNFDLTGATIKEML